MSSLGKRNPQEVAYLLEVDEDSLRYRLTFFTGEAATLDDYLQALQTFIDDAIDDPESIHIFESDIKSEYC